jgi:2'-5' RNA ligase
MRTFIAIELPQQIKEALAGIQNKLKESGADVKWVEPNNIHLTLKFLGEINDGQLEKLTEIIEDAAKDKQSFEVNISSIGAFPKIDYPRVIWVGIDKGDRETKAIAKELEDRIQKIGIPKEDRAFSSHITIARTRSTLNRDKLVQGLKALSQDFGRENWEFTVTKITLFKSTLTPNGPIYEVLKEARLIKAT